MTRWADVKEHLALVIKEGRIPDDEPIVLKFPRQLAKKRIKNTEKKSRVCWVTTPENFSLFHKARNHVIEAVGNPVIADKLIGELILKVPAETWKSFEEKGSE